MRRGLARRRPVVKRAAKRVRAALGGMLSLPRSSIGGFSMVRIVPLAFAFVATAALADGGVTVPLPVIPPLSAGEQEHLLMQLVVANVVSQNCDAFYTSDAEWALLTGSADLVARALNLSVETYDDRFYQPAFALLDKGETCIREGPRVRPLINTLIGWGGSLTPVE